MILEIIGWVSLISLTIFVFTSFRVTVLSDQTKIIKICLHLSLTCLILCTILVGRITDNSTSFLCAAVMFFLFFGLGGVD